MGARVLEAGDVVVPVLQGGERLERRSRHPSDSTVGCMSTTLESSVAGDEKLVTERIDQLLAEHDPKQTDTTTFLGAQFDLGLAWVHFPEGEGGLSVSPALQRLVNERLAAVGAPNAYM